MKLLIAYPTRNRGTEPIREMDRMVRDSENVVFHVVMDWDDKGIDEMREAIEGLSSYAFLTVKEPTTKIDAINAACHFDRYYPDWHDWQVLCQFSDDLKAWVPGWDEIIREDIKRYFSNMDGVLWYDWDNQPEFFTQRLRKPVTRGTERHRSICINIAPVMTKGFFIRALNEQLYHPEYRSFYCDEEFMSWVQQKLGHEYMQWTGKRIAHHAHPSWMGGMEDDDTYARSNPNYSHDRIVFNRRKTELGIKGRHQL